MSRRPPPPPPAGYRADIDGLRAVAVIAVVFYHAGLPAFSGGFVGVDVFFVISGFLIGGIVDREIAEGRFSFVSFYARRARRILPALIVLSLIVLAAGLILLSPRELTGYARNGFAALLGLSNIQYARGSDYFAPAAHLDPFLMTWSLGVEEQFYVFLPPLLLLLFRYRFRTRMAVLLGVMGISLAACIVLTASAPRAAFYLIPTRAWELGLGVVLALMRRRGQGPLLGQGSADLAGALGLGAIVLCIPLYDGATAFPGLAALLPVLGSTALIAAEGGRINRLLAVQPLQAIGLLSYSWYLYHWPFMAFTRSAALEAPSPELLSVVALISLGAAWLSWRYVERPFRHSQSHHEGRQLLGYGAVLAACSGVFLAVHLTAGLPMRAPALAERERRLAQEERGDRCLAAYGDSTPDLSARCWTPGPATHVALLGDSHAAALEQALRDLLAARGEGLAALNKSSCPAFFALARRVGAYPAHAAECAAFNDQALMAVIADPQITTVVLAGYWRVVIRPQPGNGNAVVDPLDAAGSDADLFRTALRDTVSRLTAAGKRVIVLGGVPILGFNPSRQMRADYLPARGALQQVLSPAGLITDGWIAAEGGVRDLATGSDALIRAAIADLPGVTFHSLARVLCPGDRCRFAGDQDRLFYVDVQHLSRAGATHVLGQTGLFSAQLAEGGRP